jgi:YHS domain-containing protein/thioredoxin-related protein
LPDPKFFHRPKISGDTALRAFVRPARIDQMKQLQRGLLTLAMLGLLAPSVLAEGVWYQDLGEARREAERLNRPILCHFGAKWCAPCQKMERTVLNQPAVMEQIRGQVVALKIDVDAHRELAQRFGVDRFPTDVFLEPNGQRLMQSTGYHPPDEYLAMIDRASRRYQDLVASRMPKADPASAPVAAKPEKSSESTQLVKNSNPMLMLEGYCPVSLQRLRRWEKGQPQLRMEYKGQLYQFSSAESRDEFLKAPDQFVPGFLGCDPVVIFDADRAVPGSIEWGAYYDGHLYLFTSDEHRRKFKAAPDKYLRTRVVLEVQQIEAAIR